MDSGPVQERMSQEDSLEALKRRRNEHVTTTDAATIRANFERAMKGLHPALTGPL